MRWPFAYLLTCIIVNYCKVSSGIKVSAKKLSSGLKACAKKLFSGLKACGKKLSSRGVMCAKLSAFSDSWISGKVFVQHLKWKILGPTFCSTFNILSGHALQSDDNNATQLVFDGSKGF